MLRYSLLSPPPAGRGGNAIDLPRGHSHIILGAQGIAGAQSDLSPAPTKVRIRFAVSVVTWRQAPSAPPLGRLSAHSWRMEAKTGMLLSAH